jgi:hypothetical protein
VDVCTQPPSFLKLEGADESPRGSVKMQIPVQRVWDRPEILRSNKCLDARSLWTPAPHFAEHCRFAQEGTRVVVCNGSQAEHNPAFITRELRKVTKQQYSHTQPLEGLNHNPAQTESHQHSTEFKKTKITYSMVPFNIKSINKEKQHSI